MKHLFPSRHALFSLALLVVGYLPAMAQTGVGIGTKAADPSAALDVVSSSQGVLLPRMTSAERQAIASPAATLLVYQTDAPAGFYYNAGTPTAPAWTLLNAAAGDNLGDHTATQALNLQGFALTGTGADVGAAVGVGVRADGGLNLGQNTGNNIFLGYASGTTTTGTGNVFIGVQSGGTTTTGANNVFSGNQSGFSNTTGYGNVFNGAISGYSNTSGANNTFNGFKSGFNNTGGYGNTFSGYNSGYYNTTGPFNTFSGLESGFSNTTGFGNVFNGSGSGYSNTTGFSNVFSGTSSGLSNTTGSANVFTGSSSGASNTTGLGNVFTGYLSGNNNTTGSGNVFLGYYSGSSNTTGGDNLFSGNQSGLSNTTGFGNVFSGSSSGSSNTTGSLNVFSGLNSGRNNTTGGSNTALGNGAGPATGALINTTALGNGAEVSTSNTIQLGNASITGLRCKVGLTITSDERFKYDVRADVPGLAFITALRPVTYRFDDARLGQFERTGALAARSAPDPAAAVHTGFLAQDVERTAQALGFRFDGVHAPANARDHYGLGYAQFVVPLVKAVQELSAEVETLKTRNAALQSKAAQADADHASLLTLQQQMARLLGEGAQASK